MSAREHSLPTIVTTTTTTTGSGTVRTKKRWICPEIRCGKSYSRLEHLQRHQLNHNPKEFHYCDAPGCQQKFVRRDLLQRHKRMHNQSASQGDARKRARLSMGQDQADVTDDDQRMLLPAGLAPSPSQEGSVISTSDVLQPVPMPPGSSTLAVQAQSALAHQSTAALAPLDGINFIRKRTGTPKPSSLSHAQSHVSAEPAPSQSGQTTFVAWLLDPQRKDEPFQEANIPFHEGCLETAFNTAREDECLANRIRGKPSRPISSAQSGSQDMSDLREREILRWIGEFLEKQNTEDGREMLVNRDYLEACIQQFWSQVSPRLPIIHRPTSSPNSCSILLLLVIIALGGRSLQQESPYEYGAYGWVPELIASSARWQVLSSEDAQAPVELWVVQALILLEYYEMMLSTAKMHERAITYHSATLRLLRAGNPLIGRSANSSTILPDAAAQDGESETKAWWVRWAETEAMHRVIYTAFMMDTVHASIFGHAAEMDPHEIRLPLPCDDALWSATTPEIVRQQEANLRMYGLKPVFFLDGLKKAVHGQAVPTHSFGRMIIMYGLMNVAWHVKHQGTHSKWVDLPPYALELRNRWSSMLTRAFDEWKASFDQAIGAGGLDKWGQQAWSVGPMDNPSALHHLAHISLAVDIMDCQILAEAAFVNGRDITVSDHNSTLMRMKMWFGQDVARSTVLHAFELLHGVLFGPRPDYNTNILERDLATEPEVIPGSTYTAASDPDPHRPWVIYYAVLVIWCFVRASGGDGFKTGNPNQTHSIAEYLSTIARLVELNADMAAGLSDGLSQLLRAVTLLLSAMESDMFREAVERLRHCEAILAEAASSEEGSS